MPNTATEQIAPEQDSTWQVRATLAPRNRALFDRRAAFAAGPLRFVTSLCTPRTVADDSWSLWSQQVLPGCGRATRHYYP